MIDVGDQPRVGTGAAPLPLDTHGQSTDWRRHVALEAIPAFDPDGPVADGPIEVIDLFAGCGGLSVGFEAVGRIRQSFRLRGAVELNENSAATYAANLPIAPVIADLSAVAREPDVPRWFDDAFASRPGSPLVLIGGPPCQGFSAHRKKHGPALSDDRNNLVVDFVEIARLLQPDLIVMENVPELLARRHWQLFERARDILTEAGYQVRAQIHNLAGFGVPQERFRALVVASRSDLAMPQPFLDRPEFRTVRDAIGLLPEVLPGEVAPGDPFHRSARHASTTLDVIRMVPRDGGRRPAGVGPACLQEVDGFRDVYGRLYWDKPANTVTAYARNPASGRYVHPDQDRGLTIREAALLQGFPIRFAFTGSFDHMFWQIGNAVPPVFAGFLAAHVLDVLRGDAEESGVVEDIRSPQSNSFSSGIAWKKWRP